MLEQNEYLICNDLLKFKSLSVKVPQAVPCTAPEVRCPFDPVHAQLLNQWTRLLLFFSNTKWSKLASQITSNK